MERHNKRFKRKKPRRPWGAPASLNEKIAEMGGQTGLALEIDPTSGGGSGGDPPIVSHGQEARSAGIFGQRTEPSVSSSVQQTRLFQSTPRNRGSSASLGARSGGGSTVSRRSRFSRASMSRPSRTTTTAVHVVCAISENLARETCVSSLDAGSPSTVQVGNPS